MGNTPSSAQASPARGGHASGGTGGGGSNERALSPTKGGSMTRGGGSPLPPPPAPSSSSTQTSPPTALPTPSGSLNSKPPLKIAMPKRPSHVSPDSSNPNSPGSGPPRGSSPRRRKSLELPDLNRLSFTPAAPVPTLATNTSHHLAPSTTAAASSSSSTSTSAKPGHVKKGSAASSALPASLPDEGSPSRRWRMSLGGKRFGGGAAANALSAMTKLDDGLSASVPSPQTAPINMPSSSKAETNPYFPSSPPRSSPPPRVAMSPDGRGRKTSPKRQDPVDIPATQNDGLKPVLEPAAQVIPPAPRFSETSDKFAPTDDGEMGFGLVSVPLRWDGGGKNVYVTGNFANNWKNRFKLQKNGTAFETTLRLPPGQYRLKFIVDDSWRCSKNISTATDDDGTLVNWLEVEAPKTEDETRAEWAMDAKPAAKHEDTDDAQWTSSIPAPLFLYQYIEEMPSALEEKEDWAEHFKTVPYLTPVPQPPVLPRILEKVIVNAEPKRSWDEQYPGTSATPAGLDDNSILAVPNHVVLNHLTASAIKNGTLGVGTTTRYRKKYITTMYFKPTLGDLMDAQAQAQAGRAEENGQPAAQATEAPPSTT